MTLDDLELELRKLPGVRAAGFNKREDVLLVQLHAETTEHGGDLPIQALRIAYRHSDQPVAVEVVRWRERVVHNGSAESAVESVVDLADDAAAPPDVADPRLADTNLGAGDHANNGRERRVRLLAVLTFPDTDEVEVHLTLDGQRSIGRAESSRGAQGAVDAAFDALRRFAPTLDYRQTWAKRIDHGSENERNQVLCAVELRADDSSSTIHGIARGANEFEAATRATLHALNRTLALELWAAK